MLDEGVVVLIILLACSIAPETAATMYRYLWQVPVVFAVIRLYKHEVEVRPPLHCGRMNVNPPVYYIVQK